MEWVAKSHMRKGFLIYEEKRKYLTIYEGQPIPSKISFIVQNHRYVLVHSHTVHCTLNTIKRWIIKCVCVCVRKKYTNKIAVNLRSGV